MPKQYLYVRILVAMYRAASRGRFLTPSTLAQLLELEVAILTALLRELDRTGYVDMDQLRLTLPGLAVAVAAVAKPKARTIANAA